MTISPSTNTTFVLGAGPAGLAAAYQLSKAANQSTVVLERDSRVGGLAKSLEYQDFILDYGPHRFYTKLAPVLALWDEVLQDEQVTVNRLTRIYYEDKYFNYPLKATEAIFALGFWESSRIIASYAKAKLFPNRHPENFAEWVSGQFGRRLFEIFFDSYTEKLWGIPCTDISADWAAQRIKTLSLGKAMRTALLGNDGKIKTLIDQFQYPRLGSGQLYDRIYAELEKRQQSVLLNTEVVKLHHQDGQITHVTMRDRKTQEESMAACDHVISSIPITLLLEQMDPQPPEPVLQAARSLKFRNTILVYLIVEAADLFPDNWLYINDGSVGLGRVTNFRNWSPDMLPNDHQTPLCCEYWCNFDEAGWTQSDDRWIEQATQDLRKISLLGNQRVSSGFVLRLPRTYPIYAGDYKQSLQTLQSYLQGFQNLQLVGRYGSFKYNNQDHSLLMGILAAENVLEPGKHDLWTINSDSEYVEEARAEEATTAAIAREVSRRQRVLQTGQRFGRYLGTGSTATLVDVFIFVSLLKLDIWYVFALLASFCCGLTLNFFLSRRYVFGVYWKNGLFQYLIFAAVALNSLLANLGLLQIMMNELSWSPTISRLISAGLIAVLSFSGHQVYSFANRNS